MRQIGNLPDMEQALTLADYLLSMQIETRLEHEPDGCWAVWVCDEDRLPRAREELAAFLKTPLDPRFVEGAKAERARRRVQPAEDDDDDSESPTPTPAADAARQMHPATMIVMLLTILVGTLTLPKAGNPLERVLSPEIRLTVHDNDPTLPEVRAGQIWRLVTPALVHLSLTHWIFNIFWLVDLGGQVEERRGSGRFLMLVLALAVISNLVQFYLGHPSLENGRLHLDFLANFAGLSGVVYGLFGYVWIKSRMAPDEGFVLPAPVTILLLGWLVFCFTPWAEGLVGPIANGAHLGGFLAGVSIGAVPAMWRTVRDR